MNKKIVVSLTLAALLVPLVISVVPVNAWSYPDGTEDTQWEKFGPRADKLLIKLHTDDVAEFTAFETGAFDVVDFPLPKAYVEKWSAPPYSDDIKVLPYGAELGMFLVDINNNPNEMLGCPEGIDSAGNPLPPEATNPVYPNPTGVPEIRHAIFHCMDRAYVGDVILEGYGVPMYTPVPPSMPNYVHEEIVPGGALEDLTHPYSIDEAKALLDAAGVVDGPDADDWREFPVALGGDGENILLKYYIRSDHAPRRDYGLWHADQIELAGLQVDRRLFDSAGCHSPVMIEHDFNLYTGGWGLGPDPDHLILYMWWSMGVPGYYWYPGFCYNYGAVNCPEFDAAVDVLLEANTFDEAKMASYEAQEAIMDPTSGLGMAGDGKPGFGGVGVLNVYCAKGFKAHQRRYVGGTPEEEAAGYTGQLWKGIINMPAYGCDQDFFNMYPEGQPVGDGEHMTVRWGFKVDDIVKLNPIYAEWLWDWHVLGRIYSSLLTRDDYTFEWIPSLAKAFDVGTWIDPADGLEKSKVRITLRSDLYWHDGVPVSTADVIWSLIEEPKELRAAGLPPPWGSESLVYIKSFYVIDPCNIEILLSLKSVWAVGWIGGYNLHPKHIWKPLIDSYVATGNPDLTAFSPDPDLIGSANWRLEEYVGGPGGHILMRKAKQSQTLTTNLENELGPARPVHMSAPVYRTCPVYVDVHPILPEEYEYAQKIPPSTDVTWKITMHNMWLNPIPNSATGVNTGSLIVNKYVYYDGELILGDPPVEVTLPACEIHEEEIVKHVEKGSHTIKVAVHITGPEKITVSKEGATIEVDNPWICTWQNYTWYFWGTIKPDIAGAYFDTWHGKKYVVPGGTDEYMVPKGVPAPDSKVNIVDIFEAAKAFGVTPGHARWSAVADVNGDYRVNIVDIFEIAKMFGW